MTRPKRMIAKPAAGSVQSVEEATCANCGEGIVKLIGIPDARWWHRGTGLTDCLWTAPERASV